MWATLTAPALLRSHIRLIAIDKLFNYATPVCACAENLRRLPAIYGVPCRGSYAKTTIDVGITLVKILNHTFAELS